MSVAPAQDQTPKPDSKLDRPPFSEHEIRRIFGYQPAAADGSQPEIAGVLTPIKAAIQQALGYEFSFVRNVDGTFDIYHQYGATDRGDIARRLKIIIGRLASDGNRQKFTFDDFKALVAEKQIEWTKTIAARKQDEVVDSIEFFIGNQSIDEEAYQRLYSRQGAFIKPRLRQGETLVDLDDDLVKQIREDFYGAYDMAVKEVSRSRPLTLETLLRVATGAGPKEKRLEQIVAQKLGLEIEPRLRVVRDVAAAPALPSQYVIYIPESLHRTLSNGAPPEEIQTRLDQIADSLGVNIISRQSVDLTPKKHITQPIDKNTGQPYDKASVEAQKRQKEELLRTTYNIRSGTGEADNNEAIGQARKIIRREITALEGILGKIDRYEAEISEPPSGHVVLSGEQVKNLSSSGNEALYPSILVSARTQTPGAAAQDVERASLIVRKTIDSWVDFERRKKVYEQSLREFNLDRRIKQYQTDHNAAVLRKTQGPLAITNTPNDNSAGAQYLRALLIAAETWNDRPSPPGPSVQAQHGKARAVKPAPKEAETVTDECVAFFASHMRQELAAWFVLDTVQVPETLRASLDTKSPDSLREAIKASLAFTRKNPNPTDLQPKPPVSNIDSVVERMLKAPKNRRETSEAVAVPPPSLDVAALASMEAIEAAKARLAAEQEVFAKRVTRQTEFLQDCAWTIRFPNRDVFNRALGGAEKLRIPTHINAINRALNIELVLPPKDLEDFWAVGISQKTALDRSKLEQVQQILTDLHSRATSRQGPVSLQEAHEVIDKVKQGDVAAVPTRTISSFALSAAAATDPDMYYMPLGKAAPAFQRGLEAIKAAMGRNIALSTEGDTLIIPYSDHSGALASVVQKLRKEAEAFPRTIITQTKVEALFNTARQVEGFLEGKDRTRNGSLIRTEGLQLPTGNTSITDAYIIHAPGDASYTTQAHLCFSSSDLTIFDDLRGKDDKFIKQIVASLPNKVTITPVTKGQKRLTILGPRANIEKAIEVIYRFEGLLNGGAIPSGDTSERVRQLALDIAFGRQPESDLFDESKRNSTRVKTADDRITINPQYMGSLNPYQLEFRAAVHARKPDGKPANPYIIVPGPPGTTKTWSAVTFALEALNDPLSNFRKLICVAPDTSVNGEKKPFLPGDEWEKNKRAWQMLIQHLEHHLGVQGLAKLRASGKILFIPESDIRGLSWEDSIILSDETQNSGQSVATTLMGRPKDNSIMIMLGDPKQCDLAREASNLRRDLRSGREDPYEIPHASVVPDTVRMENGDLVIEHFGKEIRLPNASQQAHWIREPGSDRLQAFVAHNAMTYLLVKYNNMPLIKVVDFTNAPNMRNKDFIAIDARDHALSVAPYAPSMKDGRGIVHLKR